MEMQMESLENEHSVKLVIMDEHWLMFEPLSEMEGFKELQKQAQEFGSTIKQAIINGLEIDKQSNTKSY